MSHDFLRGKIWENHNLIRIVPDPHYPIIPYCQYILSIKMFDIIFTTFFANCNMTKYLPQQSNLIHFAEKCDAKSPSGELRAGSYKDVVGLTSSTQHTSSTYCIIYVFSLCHRSFCFVRRVTWCFARCARLRLMVAASPNTRSFPSPSLSSVWAKYSSSKLNSAWRILTRYCSLYRKPQFRRWCPPLKLSGSMVEAWKLVQTLVWWWLLGLSRQFFIFHL